MPDVVLLHADPDPIRDDLWCDQCGEAIAVGCILAQTRHACQRAR